MRLQRFQMSMDSGDSVFNPPNPTVFDRTLTFRQVELIFGSRFTDDAVGASLLLDIRIRRHSDTNGVDVTPTTASIERRLGIFRRGETKRVYSVYARSSKGCG